MTRCGTDGWFVTLEGIEGVGKSTHVVRIQRAFEAHGFETVLTREPGGTPIGEAVRALLLDPAHHGAMHVHTELLLMFAARAQHLHELIKPALAAGKAVICDRFTDSTYAYQGSGRGLPHEQVHILEALVQQQLRPHLTLLFDASASVGRQRAEGRCRGPDRFERESHAYFQAVRQGFLDRAAAEPERIKIIDAGQSMPQVAAQVDAVMAELLG